MRNMNPQPNARQRIDLATRRIYENHTFSIQPPVRDRYPDALNIGDDVTVYGKTVDGRNFTINNASILEDWHVYIGRGEARKYGFEDGGLADITLVTEA